MSADYVVQEHRRWRDGVYAVTLWSKQRQAKKRIRAGLSGRQLRKLRKSHQRAARADVMAAEFATYERNEGT